jgi:ribosomal protein S27AE
VPETNEQERQVELKVCERCGGLWLRPEKSRWIYCGPCKSKVDELPEVTLKAPKKRRRGKQDGEAVSQRVSGKERVQ